MDKVENLLMAIACNIKLPRRVTRIKRLTLNKLALVPITKPIWSKEVVHAVLLSGCPLFKCVPA